MHQLQNRFLKQQKKPNFSLRATFHLYWVFFSTNSSQVTARCMTKAWWEKEGLLWQKLELTLETEDHVSSQLSQRVGVTICNQTVPLSWLPKTLWPGYKQGKCFNFYLIVYSWLQSPGNTLLSFPNDTPMSYQALGSNKEEALEVYHCQHLPIIFTNSGVQAIESCIFLIRMPYPRHCKEATSQGVLSTTSNGVLQHHRN